MAPSIALLSTAAITRAELADFVVRCGGVVEEENDQVGRISQDARHLWINLSPRELRSTLEDEELEEFRHELVELLGGSPVSYVGVDFSRAKGTGAIALAFAIGFTRQWPAVVDDDGELLGHADLLEVEQGCRPSYVFSR